jgi:hypothetical protein
MTVTLGSGGYREVDASARAHDLRCWPVLVGKLLRFGGIDEALALAHTGCAEV